MILPFDAKEVPDSMQLKCFEATLLPGIYCPCLTAIQQDAENTRLVHLNPCGLCSFSHTFLVSLDMAEESLPMRLMISASVDRYLVMVEPM